ncbi:hypothetical protein PtA15_11A401 [Puccinia triticina]|uniref:Uncharacterized protein n=1 Tax=Puccinia triticina TaxID=208348 RepID=A0ABY7CXP5_9BASI|nr:uncharacterized protein PtA15_11A401 [Puccinia triticina]WAQ89710.1 hypothetical protein PtA15_11A401 [Puccinia triticina]WAR59754.1 hypothetical protein PtB15_11B394 [Puccinia triticina]
MAPPHGSYLKKTVKVDLHFDLFPAITADLEAGEAARKATKARGKDFKGRLPTNNKPLYPQPPTDAEMKAACAIYTKKETPKNAPKDPRKNAPKNTPKNLHKNETE